MKNLLPPIALIIVFAATAFMYEKAKRETAHIDVCAKEPTPQAKQQCYNLVAFAQSAGW